MMTHRRKTILVLLVVIAVAAGGFTWWWHATAAERRAELLLRGLRGEEWGSVTQWLVEWGVVRAPGRTYDEVVEGLTAIGPPAVPSLILALREENRHVRSAAATVLGRIGDKRAVAPLARRMGEKDAYTSLTILGNLTEPYHARGAMARALGRLGDPGAVEPLIAALSDEDVVVRYFAVAALSEIGDRRAVGPLITRLRDEEWGSGCVEVDQGSFGIGRSVQRYPLRAAGIDALAELGDPRAVEVLIAAYDDPWVYVKERAVRALGRMGDRRAVPVLLNALGDGIWEEGRWFAAQGLGELSDPRAVEPLIEALTDEGSCVPEGVPWEEGRDVVEPLTIREQAARALGKLGDPRAIEPLRALLRDEDERVRDAVRQALERLGQREER